MILNMMAMTRLMIVICIPSLGVIVMTVLMISLLVVVVITIN